MASLASLLNLDGTLTPVIQIGSPDLRHKLFQSPDSASLVPLGLHVNGDNKDCRVGAARSNEHETGSDFTAYGAKLAALYFQEEKDFSQLLEDQSRNPSPGLSLDVQRRALRLGDLNAAIWALHMIGIGNCPEVHQLLVETTEWMNMTTREAMDILKTAQDAVISGEIETLKTHIKNLAEQHQRDRCIPERPASELEMFMLQMPTSSAVLSRLQVLQQIASQNTEASRLLLDDTFYQLWWMLEQKICQFLRD